MGQYNAMQEKSLIYPKFSNCEIPSATLQFTVCTPNCYHFELTSICISSSLIPLVSARALRERPLRLTMAASENSVPAF